MIEVHHIVPPARGGTDDFDNAIPLCFDCHAWAGHFFAGHPRGTAYSPSEMRKARDDWYSKVERGEIAVHTEQRSPLHVRYFLCRDWDITAALFKGDLSLAPVENALLARTPVTRIAKTVLSLQSGYRSALIHADSYKTIEEFRAAHPEAAIKTTYPYATTANPGYAFYNSVRQCSGEEISKRILTKDPVSSLLAANGADLRELAIAVADNGDCGDGSVCESYRVRPIWPLFVAITNTASEPIAVESISGLIDIREGIRQLSVDAAPGEWPLPRCEIAQQQTIFAPVAILVAPLEELGEKISAGETIVHQGEYSQVTHAASFPDAGIEHFRALGPRMRPKSIFVRSGSSRIAHDVHDFDLENVFTIDRNWECGSCPHLFFVSKGTEEVHYGRELIPRGAGRVTYDAFAVPLGTKHVVFAELEDEVTYIQAVLRDGVIICEDVWMRRGESLIFPVDGASAFQVVGAYYSKSLSTPRMELAAMRNKLICRFLRNCESQPLAG